MWYRLIRFLVLPWFKLLYMPKIKGKENIPKDGNYIIVCNHFGKADPIVILSMYKQKTYFLAKKEWFSTKIKSAFFTEMGAIPVDREKADFNSIKKCLTVLRRGDILTVFPEGTRNRKNDELQPLKGGAGMLAFTAKVPVLPIALKKKFRAFRKNELYIGKPFDYSDYYGEKYNSSLDAVLTERMRERLQGVVDLAQGKGSES